MIDKAIKNNIKIISLLILTQVVSGCSAMRSYDKELSKTVTLVANNQVDDAIRNIDSNNEKTNQDLLYFLEKGELLRLKNQYPESIATWLQADRKINEWEQGAKIKARSFLENTGSILVNDKTRTYEGHDYEKVLLSTRLALDYLLSGDWDSARTEIKKTHEREAIIEDIKGLEASTIASESSNKNIQTTFKDLKGYPVHTLDSPEAIALKNSYQSAFSHYLAGFVYEALNEPSLAAPGYRKAIELRPNIKELENGLANLETRMKTRTPNTTDVLFVVESGVAPSLTSAMIPLPVFVGNIGVIPISFPILKSDATNTTLPLTTIIDNTQNVPLTAITSVDAMSRRALRDDMPGIILRGTLRAAAKAASQQALMNQRGALALAGIALNIANIVTESADERTWRTLPSSISVARVSIPSGQHEFSINSAGSNNKKTLEIKGSHAVVFARLIGNQFFWSEPKYSEKMPTYITPILTESTSTTDAVTTATEEKKPEPLAKPNRASKKKLAKI